MHRGFLFIYHKLLAYYGPQYWWPADTPFEVAVGAVLTQNTSWINVEKAIGQLKETGNLRLESILGLSDEQLAALIQPAGFHNIKSRRLKNLCEYLAVRSFSSGSADHSDGVSRNGLLEVNGIGPETADAILLYACGRPMFVIDAYARRIFSRIGLISGQEKYQSLAARFLNELPEDVDLFKEYHALIVEHGKRHCLKNARCVGCPLTGHCDYFYD